MKHSITTQKTYQQLLNKYQSDLNLVLETKDNTKITEWLNSVLGEIKNQNTMNTVKYALMNQIKTHLGGYFDSGMVVNAEKTFSTKKRPLSKTEQKQVLKVLEEYGNEKFLRSFEFLMETGLRIQEFCSLTSETPIEVKNIHQMVAFRVRTGKTGEIRAIAVRCELWDYFYKNGFPNMKTLQWYFHEFNKTGLFRHHITAHTCRYTFATNAVLNGIGVEYTSKALGNTVEVCKKYYFDQPSEFTCQLFKNINSNAIEALDYKSIWEQLKIEKQKNLVLQEEINRLKNEKVN